MKKLHNLKNILLLPVLAAGFCGCSLFGPSQQSGAGVITPDFIGERIKYLASDSLRGRNTPSEELDKAAEYIASEFRSFGLKPAGGSYFQNVNLTIVELGKDNYLTITKTSSASQVREFKIKDDFTPFENTADRAVKGSAVFAGYGITAPEYSYDDYKGLDVKGKIVVILKHEPRENDTASVFDGQSLTEYSTLEEKTANAVRHGAAGIIMINDPLNHTSLTPRGFPWPSLSRMIPREALPTLIDLPEVQKLPVVQGGEEVVKYLFGSVDSLKRLQKSIDSMMKPASFEIPGTEVSLKTDTELYSKEIKERQPKNVVAVLEGSDPVLKNEYIVIGGHYDHVGYRKNHEAGTDYIFNGADDNASGTSGVIAVAKAFSSLEKRPARSILFITFAGEEKGLLGSQYYVMNPLVPLTKTVAMFNMDMISRNSPDSLIIIGSGSSARLKAINEQENKKTGFRLYYEEEYLAQSDHAGFYKKGIPVLFYFSGLHKDYHKVSDEFSLVDTEKAANVARLCFYTARRIAAEGLK